MGSDAVIQIVPAVPLTEALLARFRADFPVEFTFEGQSYPRLVEHVSPYGSLTEAETMWRYYKAHYQRGPWPKIERMIRWLQANTASVVSYGSDQGDPVEDVTEETLARLSASWDANGSTWATDR